MCAIPIQHPKLNEEVSGEHPVIIIGPNGSGKSRFGAEVAQRHSGERIAALRNPVPKTTIPRTNPNRLARQVENQKSNAIQNPWQEASDINQLMGKLAAQDAERSTDFTRSYSPDNPPDSGPSLYLETVEEIWKQHFPDREIDLSDYDTEARTRLTDQADSYNLRELSDGEKVALYLIARVVDAEPGVLVVDEPTLHLHPELARRLWDDLENQRDDCRFIYMTHNLNFALSRQGGQFIVMNPDRTPKKLPHGEEIPEEVVETVLGAATFAVAAKRIVFCEGEDDIELYEAWFDEDTAVVSAGGSREVAKSVRAVNSQEVFTNVQAIGVVDRDYHSDEYLQSLPESVESLSVYEYESLFCLPQVFKGIASYHGYEYQELEPLYDDFIERIRDAFVGPHLMKGALERAKEKIMRDFDYSLNEVTPSPSLEAVSTALEEKEVDGLSDVFEDEVIYLRSERDRSVYSTLKHVPGKSAIDKASDVLGIEEDVLVQNVLKALRSTSKTDDESTYTIHDLRQNVIEALDKQLPSRSLSASNTEADAVPADTSSESRQGAPQD